jgi:BCD family chlorophyll transporter-like MFS transporter
MAPRDQAGLALGAWGAVQATAAGAAIALGGVLRDVVAGVVHGYALGAAAGYDFVYGLEMVLLLITLGAMLPLLRRSAGKSAPAR